jgi:hypothetical protein
MIYNKIESKDMFRVTKAAVLNFKIFCKDSFGKNVEDVLTQLKEEESNGKIFNLLNDFIDWLVRITLTYCGSEARCKKGNHRLKPRPGTDIMITYHGSRQSP